MTRCQLVPNDPEFRRLWSSDMRIEDIADRYDVALSTVSLAARRYGLAQRRSGPPRVIDEAELRRLWNSGMTTAEIARCYGVTRQAISLAARRFGFSPRKKGGAPRSANPNEQREVLIVDADRMPRDERMLRKARLHGRLARTDFWTLERDLQLMRAAGRYDAMDALARRWRCPYSRLLSRWHLLRVL